MSKDEQIFDHIRELMTRDDFRNAQSEFFKANHSKFHTQENEGEAQFKLEHKTIHEDYLGLVEKFIEMKLQMEFGHSDEEMDHFYLTFKDKFKAYEAKDPESVDILYGFLDLEKFFAQMVETTKTLAIQINTDEATSYFRSEAEKDTDRAKVDSKEYLAMLDADPDEPKNGWVKKVEMPKFERGYKIKVHQKKAQKGEPDFVRAESIIQGVDFKDIAQLYRDPPMSEMLKANEVIEGKIEDNGYEYYELKYWRLKLPMMSDRENIVKTNFRLQEDGRLFGVGTSVEHPDYPPTAGCVQMHQFIILSMEKLADGSVRIREIIQQKLMGYVPSSLMNMVVCNEVFKEHKRWFDHMLAKKA